MKNQTFMSLFAVKLGQRLLAFPAVVQTRNDMVSGLRSNCSVVFVMTLLLAGLLAACGGGTNASPGDGGTGSTDGSNSSLVCNVMATGQGASLGGFVPFNSNSAWNTDISTAPVDPNSATIISNFVGSVNVHPDFGTDPSYGIPYVVVNGSQSLVNVNLNAYASESDPGPMPVPANAPVVRRRIEHRRPACARARQPKLFSLRAVQLFAEF
jgi:hypothetical protein